MKKNIWIISGVAVLLIVFLFFFLKPASFMEILDDLHTSMQSYHLKGVMELVKGEDQKAYDVEVLYKKSDQNDLFKVSIHDKELNQTQIILRNKEGVYVVTPTLNQIFKFEGDWPLNSLKPYLLQSIYEIIKSEDCTIEKNNSMYFAKSEVNYPNNESFKMQEMVFNEKGIIQEITIKDEKDVQQLHLTFQDVNYNEEIKEQEFDVPEELESEVSASYVDALQLPLYPMQIYDSKLTNMKSLQVASGTKYVLEYDGDKSFTIVESVCKRRTQTETVIMGGSLIDSINAFGFYDGNHMQWIHNGIEYTIYSEDLSVEEMSYVLNSMQVVVMK